MRHTVLRTIRHLFSSNHSYDETKPIVQPLPNMDHGTISHLEASIGDAKSLDGYEYIRDSSCDQNLQDVEDQPSPMSWMRKLCFLLSLNAGVMYVAAFLWFIPCRQPLCSPQKDWTINVSGILTSNIETVKSAGVPSSILFGCSDESSSRIVSLGISSGQIGWTIATDTIYRHVFCEFDHGLNFNTVPGCIVTAYNSIGVISSTTGQMIWSKNITDPSGETVHRAYVTNTLSNKLLIFGLSDAYLFILDAVTGFMWSTIVLPCSWTINKQLSGPWTTDNGSQWALVCDYGDSVEIWNFMESELLNPSVRGKGRLENDVQFSLLFSRSNSGGSIDLAGDVTTLRDSLVLSWSNSVVMATTEAPLQHLRTTWERRFHGPITSMTSGHFTDSKEDQIAIALQKNQSTEIQILKASNGYSVHTTDLGERNVMSMKKFFGGNRQMDVLVIESVYTRKLPYESDFSTTSSPLVEKSYFSLQYNDSNFIYKDIISAEVYASSLSSFTEGTANLFFASYGSEGYTSIQRVFVCSLFDEKLCDKEETNNSSTVLFSNKRNRFVSTIVNSF